MEETQTKNKTLFEIEGDLTAIVTLFDQIEQADDPDPETFAILDSAIDQLLKERDDKVDAYAAFIRACSARAEIVASERKAYTAEVDRLRAREKMHEARADRLKSRAKQFMLEHEMTKLEGRTSTLALHKNPKDSLFIGGKPWTKVEVEDAFAAAETCGAITYTVTLTVMDVHQSMVEEFTRRLDLVAATIRYQHGHPADLVCLTKQKEIDMDVFEDAGRKAREEAEAARLEALRGTLSEDAEPIAPILPGQVTPVDCVREHHVRVR